jgi:hypothetical protein
VHYAPADKTRSHLYLEALPLFKGHRVELLDIPRLVQQFTSLERRSAWAAGAPLMRPASSPEDCANRVAGALVPAARSLTKVSLPSLV